MRISTQVKLISTALVIVAIAAPIAQGQSYGMLLSGSHTQLKTGEGFSFKAPSYWNAAPSYWRTVERTFTPRMPRVSVNRSLGVPPQYLGGGTPAVPRTPPVSVNRSLGVPPQYLGSTSQQVSTTSAGFDWLDAGVGAAFVAGLGVLGLGAFVAVRRRHGLAELEA